jgi:uncharacterized protein
MAKILISGGSGLVGGAISQLLLKMNHQPVWLGRSSGKTGSIPTYAWDIEKGYIDEHAFDGVEFLIHLAGANLAGKRWTQAYKKQIINSRVKGSELLFKYISQYNPKIKAVVGASAVGYYGTEADERMHVEVDPPGNDFLARVCIEWEGSYDAFKDAGIRVAIIRTAVALSNKGGAFPKLAWPFQYGLGAPIGSGKQYMPWIHLNDLASLYVYALFNENLSGPFNAAADEQVTNREFSAKLANSMQKPFFLPAIPAFLLKIFMGESAVTVTKGLMVSNEKIKASGFNFNYSTLDETLTELAKNRK